MTFLCNFPGFRAPRRVAGSRHAVWPGSLVAALLLAASPASAAPTFGPFGGAVSGSIDNTGCSPHGPFNFANSPACGFAQTGGGTASSSRSDSRTGSSFGAAASIASGSVSVSATGQTWIPYVGDGSANIVGEIWDTLTFSGAVTGAVAQIDVNGTATISGDARVAAGLSFSQYSGAIADATYAVSYMLAGNAANYISNSGSYNESISVPIVNDTPYLLQISVIASAGVTGAVNPPYPPPGSATISDPFSISVPSGVTINSAYASSVPEPSASLLLLPGIAAILYLRRRIAAGRPGVNPGRRGG